jgi:hypothetical protein
LLAFVELVVLARPAGPSDAQDPEIANIAGVQMMLMQRMATICTELDKHIDPLILYSPEDNIASDSAMNVLLASDIALEE